jgi:hypothetical protein
MCKKRIRSAVVAFDQPEAPVGIPRFQYTGGHSIFPFFCPISTSQRAASGRSNVGSIVKIHLSMSLS